MIGGIKYESSDYFGTDESERGGRVFADMQNHFRFSADSAYQNQAAGFLSAVRIRPVAYPKHPNKKRSKMTTNQAGQNIIIIAERLCENAKRIRYGSVSSTLRIHNGRIVDVTHSTTESKREEGENK